MSLEFVTFAGNDDDEHWSSKFWKLLNEGNSTAIEIGVSMFIILVVIIIAIVIVIRYKRRRKRPILPPIPTSIFFTQNNQQGLNCSDKSDTLYEVIEDSSRSDQVIKNKQGIVSPDIKLLHVTQQTPTINSNSSNNEYSKEPTGFQASSGTSNDESESATPYVPEKTIFEFDKLHPNPCTSPISKEIKDLQKCPQQAEELKAMTLDRPMKRRRKRRKQQSLDFQLSDIQSDIYNFYLPMTSNKSLSIGELLRPTEECSSEYISHNNKPPIPFKITITTPEQEKDLYLLKNNL